MSKYVAMFVLFFGVVWISGLGSIQVDHKKQINTQSDMTLCNNMTQLHQIHYNQPFSQQGNLMELLLIVL